MEKIVIDSAVSEVNQEILESRVKNLLQSFVGILKSVHVTIRLKCEIEQTSLNYRCEIEGLDQESNRFIGCDQRRTLQHALEGAVNALANSLVADQRYAS